MSSYPSNTRRCSFPFHVPQQGNTPRYLATLRFLRTLTSTAGSPRILLSLHCLTSFRFRESLLFSPSRLATVLWRQLTSCGSLLLPAPFFLRQPARPPRVSAITFPSYICHIYTMGFGQYWTSLCVASSSVPQMPYM